MNVIHPIRAFADNYIWLIHNGTHALVVDPGDAEPVKRALQEYNLTLSGILITHWHNDHIGGVNALVKGIDVPVFGPQDDKIPMVTNPLHDGDTIETSLGKFSVIGVPGHTMEHIAFFNPELKALLCGDTLFSAGCGRMFEGTADVFHSSLEKLCHLPDDTLIFCAHEYTMANLHFAQAVEPTNDAIIQHANWVKQQLANNQPTLPSSIATEKQINPFLRVREPSVVDQAINQGAASAEATEIFATLREWKNNY